MSQRWFGVLLCVGLLGSRAGADETTPDATVVDVQAVDPTGQIADFDARQALNAVQPALLACYVARLRDNPTLAGRVIAYVVFGRGGKSREVRVAGSGDAALHRCATRALGKAQLESLPGLDVDVVAAATIWFARGELATGMRLGDLGGLGGLGGLAVPCGMGDPRGMGDQGGLGAEPMRPTWPTPPGTPPKRRLGGQRRPRR
jgi:hypothetical protein